MSYTYRIILSGSSANQSGKESSRIRTIARKCILLCFVPHGAFGHIYLKSELPSIIDRTVQDGSLCTVQAETMHQLLQQVEQTREALASDPENSLFNAQLGTLLQHLDYINPDGGSRIPEAERAYRCGYYNSVVAKLRS